MFDTPPEQELASCCRKGDLTRATELLEYGVRADGGHGGRSFLSLAVEARHIPILELLIRSGARAEPSDFVRALRSYDVRAVELVADLLDGRGIEYDFWADDRPLLTDPTFLGRAPVAVIRWMLAHGADPTERDRFDNDPVSCARKSGASPEIIALLTAVSKT